MLLNQHASFLSISIVCVAGCLCLSYTIMKLACLADVGHLRASQWEINIVREKEKKLISHLHAKIDVYRVYKVPPRVVPNMEFRWVITGTRSALIEEMFPFSIVWFRFFF